MIPPAKVVFPERVIPRFMDEIQEVLSSGRLTLGHHGKIMETKFLEACKLDNSGWEAVTTNSGTSALEILLRVLLPDGGGEIVMPSNTFAATAFAVMAAGFTPVFADMEMEGLGLCPKSAASCVTENTRAILTVHIGGIVSPAIKKLRDLADKNKLLLVEDAAHAHGSTLLGQVAGTFGAGASFSFYPTKVITSGEGGLILLREKEQADLARGMRDQGKQSFDSNYHTQFGYNWRMSELHAVLGKHHVIWMQNVIGDRQRTYKWYEEQLFGQEKIVLHPIPDGCSSNIYKAIAMINDKDLARKELKERLSQKEIRLAGEVYETPLHKQPVFKDVKCAELPMTEEFCDRHICLPLWYGMGQHEVIEVCDAIKEVTK